MIPNTYGWLKRAGEIEGYGLLWFFPEESEHRDKADLGGLYLTSKVLGKGLGKEIVFYMVEIAKIRGVKEIILSSTTTSKNFYESQGFHQYDEDDVTMIGGVPVEGHPMKMDLS